MNRQPLVLTALMAASSICLRAAPTAADGVLNRQRFLDNDVDSLSRTNAAGSSARMLKHRRKKHNAKEREESWRQAADERWPKKMHKMKERGASLTEGRDEAPGDPPALEAASIHISSDDEWDGVSFMAAQEVDTSEAKHDAPTLTNKIICGYQGWFSYPGDGAPINRWKHWFKNPTDPESPSLDEITIDMFPATDEYDDEDLIETGIPMRDGSFAKFYSAVKPKVVLKHFEWMETHGIAGVFHMRFMESLHLPKNREWKTMVLRNVRSAAEATGRSFAVSYNIAGATLNNDVLDDLKADWIRLVDEERITQSSRYIHQNGKPVMRIFGIGFKTVNVNNTYRLASLIDWLQNKAEQKYRVFLIGGTPAGWRTRDGDSREEYQWRGIYNSLDGIHPWHVGRWSSIANFNDYYHDKISLDSSHCKNRGILYMPTMWPGFSWYNLKKGQNAPVNQIPRLGGRFMWRQAFKYVADSNISTIWMAQFDEVDEGTAIMKVATRESEHPVDGTFLALDADGRSLPSDWYLHLCGEAQRMLEGEIALTPSLPTNMPTSSPPGSCRVVRVKILTDKYPDDTSWTLTNTCTNEVVSSRSDFLRASMHVYEDCLPGAKYEFRVMDKYGDGICCQWGNGQYSVEYGGREVAKGASFNNFETTSFGECGSVQTERPTPSPTKRPTARPTYFPTNKPTSQPTKLPTSMPTKLPSKRPTSQPTNFKPTAQLPTITSPTKNPANPPTSPTQTAPTKNPTAPPSKSPTALPTNRPTGQPISPPTDLPVSSCRATGSYCPSHRSGETCCNGCFWFWCL